MVGDVSMSFGVVAVFFVVQHDVVVDDGLCSGCYTTGGVGDNGCV